MADAYWRYADGPTVASVTLHTAPPAAQVSPLLPAKRPRTGFPDIPSNPGYLGYPHIEQGIGQGATSSTEALEASYENFLRNGVSHAAPFVAGELGRQIAAGLPRNPMDGRLVIGAGLVSNQVGFGGNHLELSRGPEMALPPDASNTLYVEGLPANCTRREVSHIFRPFVGFCEVRLVNKGSRIGGDPILLCFVDFSSPIQAAAALDALQGYKFDEHEQDSSNLRIQFARFPGPRAGAGARGRR